MQAAIASAKPWKLCSSVSNLKCFVKEMHLSPLKEEFLLIHEATNLGSVPQLQWPEVGGTRESNFASFVGILL